MSTQLAKDYIPTIIDSRSLLPRLAAELSSVRNEWQLAWPHFKRHPLQITARIAQANIKRTRQVLFAPNVIAAFVGVTCITVIVLLVDRTLPGADAELDQTGMDLLFETTILNLNELEIKQNDHSIGRDGKARVGFQQGSGEGSGKVRRRAEGGGGGGERDPLPPQTGKLPPPSTILAAIPKSPPIYPPSLPVAGIDIDPHLWKDQKVPVFGDPRSRSESSSKGPGTGGGIGTNNGLGTGEGDGPGVGPGSRGNMGGDSKQIGCCGSGGASGDGSPWDQRVFPGREVEQRAKLLWKPEPQYTEEARRNQITGTVMLRVVFSSLGNVEQIRAVQTLPFGLTDRAIAAARQIRFVPATKGGRPVSVYMQLEYNFNLY